jgi:hypothetical protein
MNTHEKPKSISELIEMARTSIQRTKGAEYAPDVHEVESWINQYRLENNLLTAEKEFNKEDYNKLCAEFLGYVNTTPNDKDFNIYVNQKSMLETNIMVVYNNVEDKNVFEGNENEFIDFMRKIVIENEDYDFSIIGLSDAIEYLEDYCSNLEIK